MDYYQLERDVILHECPKCGAAVSNVYTHTDWHILINGASPVLTDC